MNTWCTYAEYMEAMEKQLQKEIKNESRFYFVCSINAMLINSGGCNESDLMKSINSKIHSYPNSTEYFIRHNKSIMQYYANTDYKLINP